MTTQCPPTEYASAATPQLPGPTHAAPLPRNGAAPLLTILFLLVLANGIFALAQNAIVAARRTRLQQRADEGSRGAHAALQLASEPARFLPTVQLGITLVGILTGTLAGDTIAASFANTLTASGVPQYVAPSLASASVVAALALLLVLFAELARQIALARPESVAATLAPPFRILIRAAAPVVQLLQWTTGSIARVAGIRPPATPTVTADEIRILLEQGEQAGVFEPTEQDIVENALHLDELRVSAIVTPRTRIVWLDLDDDPDTINEAIFSSPHSHFPVANGALEDVSGIVRGRDILAARIRGHTDIGALIREPLFVPGSQSVLRLLEQLRHSGQHIALVLDEFGGLLGMATLTDVMEALVGEIRSAGVPHEPFIIRRPDGSWLLDGRLALHELKDLLELEHLPGEDEHDFETLAGLVMDVLARIPAAGDEFRVNGWSFRVELMEGRRISQVGVRRAVQHTV